MSIAVLIGEKTGKVLFGDTLNTFCIQCMINERDKKDKPHTCYKNYAGTPGSMEPSISVRGVNHLYKAGIKFSTIIGDRDSNVFDAIVDNCPYGEELSKADCVNHTLKNVKKGLFVVSE